MHDKYLQITDMFFYIVSVNNRHIKYTQIAILVPTMNNQLLIQLDIIAPSLIVMSYGTAYSIVALRF